MALTLDLIGGSSYMWDWKHNSIHHTYTNITGQDDDIDLGFLARLRPTNAATGSTACRAFTCGFCTALWRSNGILFDDFYQIAAGRIGDKRIPRPKGKDLVGLHRRQGDFLLHGLCRADAAASDLGGAGDVCASRHLCRGWC